MAARGGAPLLVGSAEIHDHMPAREFADMVERRGFPRPPLPVGLDVIEALDGAAVTTLAESNPVVGRLLHLVELMLQGDEQMDWRAGYSALEAIEHDLSARGVDGHARGWWTKTSTRTSERPPIAPRHSAFGRGTVSPVALRSRI
jgi:hypothetical protein